MKKDSDRTQWDKIATEVRRFARSTNPLRDMKAAGIEIDPELHELFDGRTPTFKLDPSKFARVWGEVGELPEVEVAIAHPEISSPGGPSDFGAIVTVDGALGNEVAKAFWDFRAYPRFLPKSLVRKILDIDRLRLSCVGIPDDADISRLDLQGAATVELPGNGFNINLIQPISLKFTGEQPVSLDGIFRIVLPLMTDVTDSSIYLADASVQALRADLVFNQGSAVWPKSVQAHKELNEALTTNLRQQLSIARLFYSLPSEYKLRGRFENTTIGAGALAGCVQNSGGKNYLTLGLELQPIDFSAPPNQATLVTPLPQVPQTARIMIDDGFASAVLTAAIESGDLAKMFNDKLDQVLDPFSVNPIRVKSGAVRFTGGHLKIFLDVVWVNACVAGKDLAATLTVTATVSLVNGEVSIRDIQTDADLDNSDALACYLLSALWGPFGVITTTLVLSIIAAINPSLDDRSIRVPSALEPVLPRTEFRFQTDLSSLEVQEGCIVAGAVVRLVPNITDWFVYLKVVKPEQFHMPHTPRTWIPVKGAKVSLYELDNPAPEGDDVAIPDLEPVEHHVGRFITTEIRSYHPRADEFLGIAETDDDGLVRFRVRPNATGGTVTMTRTKEAATTGVVISTTTTHTPVPEPGPDFAVSITGADGSVLALRRIIALNASDKHAGTLDNPLLVVLPKREPVIG